MTAVDNTDIVLYRYLRALSVKVSRSTVFHLLDTSEDNDMQSISDALNEYKERGVSTSTVTRLLFSTKYSFHYYTANG